MRLTIVMVLLVVACKGKAADHGPSAAAKSTNVAADAAPAPVAKAPPKSTKPARPQTSKAQYAVYRKALADGRKREQAGDHAGAMTSFRAALDANPNDATALTELGWAAYNGKDLDAAETATRRGVTLAAKPNVKAAALYNLGRIEEDRGHKDKAIAAYAQSLDLRPNQTVHDRLAGLDAAAAALYDDVLTPKPLRGPFASLDLYCKAVTAAAQEEGAWCAAEPREETGVVALSSPKPPWLAAKVIASGDDLGADCHLAVQTKVGWFVLEGFAQCENMGTQRMDVEVKEIAAVDLVAGDPLELRLRVVAGSHHNGWDDHDRREIEWDSNDWFTVCGIGASGVPSCTPEIVTNSETGVDHEEDEPNPDAGPLPANEHTQVTLDVSFTKDGAVTIKGDEKQLQGEAKKLLGTHKLRFP